MTKLLQCSVAGCVRPAKRLDLCDACYTRMRYWHQRPLKDKMRRLNQIRVWENTLEMQVSPGRKIKAS